MHEEVRQIGEVESPEHTEGRQIARLLARCLAVLPATSYISCLLLTRNREWPRAGRRSDALSYSNDGQTERDQPLPCFESKFFHRVIELIPGIQLG